MAARGELPGGLTDDVDALADRVLDRVLPTLQSRVAVALEAWWLGQRPQAARIVGAALREELARDVRDALVQALRARTD